MMWQMWTAFGIMLGYMAGVAFRSVLDAGSSKCAPGADPQTLLSISCVSDQKRPSYNEGVMADIFDRYAESQLEADTSKSGMLPSLMASPM